MLNSDTKIFPTKKSTDPEYPLSLVCGGNIVDQLTGTLVYHCRMHYENNKIVWMIYTYSGTLTNASGEVFEYMETNKVNLPESGDNSYHYNFRGDKGTHFIVSGTYIDVDPYFTIEKAVCP